MSHQYPIRRGGGIRPRTQLERESVVKRSRSKRPENQGLDSRKRVACSLRDPEAQGWMKAESRGSCCIGQREAAVCVQQHWQQTFGDRASLCPLSTPRSSESTQAGRSSA